MKNVHIVTLFLTPGSKGTTPITICQLVSEAQRKAFNCDNMIDDEHWLCIDHWYKANQILTKNK